MFWDDMFVHEVMCNVKFSICLTLIAALFLWIVWEFFGDDYDDWWY